MAHQKLPPGTVDAKGPIVHLPIGFHHSWIVQILPMLDERVAYGAINHRQSIYSNANAQVRMYSFGTLHCPSDQTRSPDSSYAGVHDSREVPIDVTNNGLLFLNSAIRFDDIIDGAGHTFIVGEKLSILGELGWASGTRSTLRNTGSAIARGAGGAWTVGISTVPGIVSKDELLELATEATGNEDAVAALAEQSEVAEVDFEQVLTKQLPAAVVEWAVDPRPASEWLTIAELPQILPSKPNGGSDVGGFGGAHTGGAQFVKSDGSVIFISASIDPAVMQAYANRADKQLISQEE